MNEKNILEESYPALEVSDDLRMRVQRLAAQSDDARAAHVTRRTMKRRVALAGALAGVAVIGVAFGPRVATAAQLWRVQNALGKLKSAHIIQWQAIEGGPRQTVETWFSGNSVRMKKQDGNIQIFDGAYNYFYTPASNQVVRKAAEGPYAHNPSGFTLESIKRDMTSVVGENAYMERLGAIQENGKTLQKIASYHTEPAGKVRMLLFVDPETSLPQRMEMALQEKGVGTWKTLGGGEFRFNETLPSSLFSPNFPGAKLIDTDALRKSWQERVEKTVVAEARLGARTVKVRDVQVNSQGAIFVLYTCDKAWEDGFMKDDQGGWWPDAARDWDLRIPGYRRLAMHFGGFYAKEKRQSSQGIRPVLEDGGQLQGDWFIPLAEKPALPRQVALEGIAHPSNLHGDAVVKEAHTLFTQAAPDDFKRHAAWSAAAKLTLAPTPYEGDFAPEYWPYLISDQGSEESFSKELSQQYTETRQQIHQDKGWPSYPPGL
ncbi:MAG: hypothetical protein QM758_30005 [Armatimonas sp.]